MKFILLVSIIIINSCSLNSDTKVEVLPGNPKYHVRCWAGNNVNPVYEGYTNEDYFWGKMNWEFKDINKKKISMSYGMSCIAEEN